MNASAESVNALQAKLDQQLEIHKSFVINFAENLALAKKNLNDKELKNAEQFYLIMHRGKFQKWILTRPDQPCQILIMIAELRGH